MPRQPTAAQLQVGRLDDVARRLLSIKGQQLFPALGDRLQAALILENDRPEWLLLGRTRLAGGFLLVANAVNSLSQFGLVNPAGSGMLGIVTEIRANLPTLNANVQVLLGRGVIGGGDSTAGMARDTRETPKNAASTVLQLRSAQIFPSGPDPQLVISRTLVSLRPPAQTDAVWTEPVVLTPGHALVCLPGDTGAGFTANTQIQGSFAWYERELQSSEAALL